MAGLALAAVLMTLLAITALRAEPPAMRAFDIAAQPLDAALDAYIRTSGTQVFYETALTVGIAGKPVKGDFTSDAALSELLAGTGLTAQRTDVDTFIIVPLAKSRAAGLAPVNAAGSEFLIALQQGVVGALCRNEQTRPGTYRLAVELWVGSTGNAQKVALVGSTGSPERDRAIAAVLDGLAIRQAPPSTMPQPFILVIGERPPRQSGDCAA